MTTLVSVPRPIHRRSATSDCTTGRGRLASDFANSSATIARMAGKTRGS